MPEMKSPNENVSVNKTRNMLNNILFFFPTDSLASSKIDLKMETGI